MTSLLFDSVILCSTLATKHSSPTRKPYTPTSTKNNNNKNQSSPAKARNLNPLPTVTTINVSHRNITPCALFTGVQHLPTQYVMELNFAGNPLSTEDDQWSLPQFLDKVSCVFPNLQHLHVTVDRINTSSDLGRSEDEEEEEEVMEDVSNTHFENYSSVTMASRSSSTFVDINYAKQHPSRRTSTTQQQQQQQIAIMPSDEFYLRLYILYRIPDLKSINGVPVTTYEQELARPNCPSGVPISNLQEWMSLPFCTTTTNAATKHETSVTTRIKESMESETAAPSSTMDQNDIEEEEDDMSVSSLLIQPKPLLLRPKDENLLVIGNAHTPSSRAVDGNRDTRDTGLSPPSPLLVPRLDTHASNGTTTPVSSQTTTNISTRRSLSSPFPLSFQKRVTPSPTADTYCLVPRRINDVKGSCQESSISTSPLFPLTDQEDVHPNVTHLKQTETTGTVNEEMIICSDAASELPMIAPKYSLSPIVFLDENGRMDNSVSMKGDVNDTTYGDTRSVSKRPEQHKNDAAKHSSDAKSGYGSFSPRCSRNLSLSDTNTTKMVKGTKKKSVTFDLPGNNAMTLIDTTLSSDYGRRMMPLSTWSGTTAMISGQDLSSAHYHAGNILNITPTSSAERMRRKREKWRKRQKFSRTKTLTESVLGEDSNSSGDEKD